VLLSGTSQVALCFPDFALVAQPVFYKRRRVSDSLRLFKGAFGGLVRFMILPGYPWLAASFFLPLDTTVVPVLPVDLVRCPRTFCPVSCAIPRVAADLSHEIDIFILESATSHLTGASPRRVRCLLAGSPSMMGSSMSIVQQRCGAGLTDSSSMRTELCVFVDFRHIERLTVEVCPAYAHNAGQGNPHRFGSIQIGCAYPYKIFYVFFLSHPIPSLCEIFLFER